MASKLDSPFQGDVKPAPGTHENENGNHYDVSQLNTPDDTSVLGIKLFEKMKGSPGALDTPMGTAIPNVGKGFRS